MSELRLHDRLDEIPAQVWDDLAGSGQPFVRHAFVSGLETTGCLRPGWGWTPRHASLWESGELVAAAPAYLKTNSHGEFVFDHAWAHAYDQHGHAYYPKWLVGVPYTPVTGPRLLAREPQHRRQLLEAMGERALRDGLSSIHVNFAPAAELESIGPGWLARNDIQFHWRRQPQWRCFDDFLDALERKKRKNIRAERRHVYEAGVTLRVVHGDEASAAELEALHALYCLSFASKGNSPALTLEFFRHLASAMPRQLVMVLAERGGELLAGAICLRDAKRLYGRYWGTRAEIPGLHFEACYYQGIEYCLREGLDVFEPGAQGEHKVARGFLPVLTHSRHWVAHPGFREALAPWCEEERAHTVRYAQMIERDHNPFRHAPALAAG
jgi:uncharacterized protein